MGPCVSKTPDDYFKEVDSWLPVSSRAWLGRFVQGYRGFECFVAYNWGKSCSENTEAVTSSEAMGYGMLIALYTSQRTYFDRLLNYYNQFGNDISGLMNWQVVARNPGGHMVDQDSRGSAFSGDCDIAYALLVAAKRWQHDQYKQRALQITAALAKHCINQTTKAPLLGDWVVSEHGDEGAGAADPVPLSAVTRTSDFMLTHFKLFEQEDTVNAKLWSDVFDACLDILNSQLRRHGNGLMPDFMVYCPSTQSFEPAPGTVVEGQEDSIFYWSAARVPWRLAFYFWETRDPRLEPFVRALADFFEAVVKEGPLVAGYTLDGEPYGDHCEVAFMAPVQGLLKVMGREEAVKLLESSIRNRIFLDWIDFTSSTMLLLVQLQLRELFQSPPPGTSSLASILIVYNFQDWPTAGSLSTSRPRSAEAKRKSGLKPKRLVSPSLGLVAASSFELSGASPREFPRQGMTLAEQIEAEGRKVLHAVVQMRAINSARDAGFEPPVEASAAPMARGTPFAAMTSPEDQPESSATAAARARAEAAAEEAALLAAHRSWR